MYENTIYTNNHSVDVIDNGSAIAKSVLVKINKQQANLSIKLRDVHDFSFNYTSVIDWMSFEKMKTEQHLEINYEEFHMQLIDLFQQALSKQMLLRLEIEETKCRIVFYEKSRIKCLIFLILELLTTNQKEIIEEMSQNIHQLKELNKNISTQLMGVKSELQEKQVLLNTALTTNHHFEKQCCKDIKTIEQSFISTLNTIEKTISVNIQRLSDRQRKLTSDLEFIKRDHKLKQHALEQALFQVSHLKAENEIQFKTIGGLRDEIKSLNSLRLQNDSNTNALRQIVVKKDKEIETLNKNIVELRKDIQEATIIVAQKTKTHDEIAKDLVQANTMLVNFNNQYDVLMKESDGLRETIAKKDKMSKELSGQLRKLSEDFESYRKDCNVEEMQILKQDVCAARQRIAQLEKENREAAKINGLLTRKLSNGDIFDGKNMNWMSK